jgi:hypothetical protein
MPTPVDQRIRDRIEQFGAELDALVREAAVASVSLALANGAPRSAGARRPGRRR